MPSPFRLPYPKLPDEDPTLQAESLPDHDDRRLSAEIAGLRELLRRLLELQPHAATGRQITSLLSAYTQTASRLADLIQSEQKSAEAQNRRTDEDQWIDDVLAFADRMAAEQGRPPESAAIRQAAERGELVIPAQPGLEPVGDLGLSDEIAAMRCSLRTALRLAGESVDQVDIDTLVRLADVYSLGCVRLAKMLRQSAGSRTRLAAYLHSLIDEAIRTVNAEHGLL